MSFYIPELDKSSKQTNTFKKNVLQDIILDSILDLSVNEKNNLQKLFKFIIHCNTEQIEGLISLIKIEGNKLQITKCTETLNNLKLQTYEMCDIKPVLIWNDTEHSFYTSDGKKATHLEIKQFYEKEGNKLQ